MAVLSTLRCGTSVPVECARTVQMFEFVSLVKCTNTRGQVHIYVCTIFLHVLKGSVTRFSTSGFFSWISFPLVNNTSGTAGKICRRCRWNRWCTLTCEYFREFPKKFEMTLMLFSGAWGKVIHEKNLKQKISWHCPFNRGKWEKCRQPDHIYIGPLLCTLRNIKQRILPFFNVRRSTKALLIMNFLKFYSPFVSWIWVN